MLFKCWPLLLGSTTVIFHSNDSVSLFLLPRLFVCVVACALLAPLLRLECVLCPSCLLALFLPLIGGLRFVVFGVLCALFAFAFFVLCSRFVAECVFVFVFFSFSSGAVQKVEAHNILTR